MKTIHITEIESAREVLTHNAFAQALYDDSSDVMSSVLLNLHGKEYADRRMVELDFFEGTKVGRFARNKVPRMIDDTLATISDANSADAVQLARFFSVRLGVNLIGIDVDFHDKEDTYNLADLASRFAEGATLVHSRRREEKVLIEAAEALEEFRVRYFEPSLKRRMSDAPNFEDSLLGRYLTHQHRLNLSDEILLREFSFFLHSAVSPTAVAIVNALHDIFMWSEKNVDRRKKLIEDFDFLRRAISESIRLHPASPVAWRKAIEPVRLSDGQWLDQGDYVIIDLIQINTDNVVYGPDAKTFNPYREIKLKINPTNLTFGAGYHECPARSLVSGVSSDATSGVLVSLIRSLLAKGIQQDPDKPAEPDHRTERLRWGVYPVIFDSNPAS